MKLLLVTNWFDMKAIVFKRRDNVVSFFSLVRSGVKGSSDQGEFGLVSD